MNPLQIIRALIIIRSVTGNNTIKGALRLTGTSHMLQELVHTNIWTGLWRKLPAEVIP